MPRLVCACKIYTPEGNSETFIVFEDSLILKSF
ncbi:MAG: hypothetical protein ACI81S_001211, partial [Sphingobacteriales bacterium]